MERAVFKEFAKLGLLTDYGRLMKPFFSEIQNFWDWADKFWGIWGIFV